MARRTIHDVLERARRRIERLEPAEAWAAAERGATIVDIRSDLARESGVIPGSLHIPRTVLEWRLDPGSPWRNPHVGGLDTRILILCDHGYSSSLAAGALAELGFARVGDVIGGFSAWAEAGLPVKPGPRPHDRRALPGMAPPEP